MSVVLFNREKLCSVYHTLIYRTTFLVKGALSVDYVYLLNK